MPYEVSIRPSSQPSKKWVAVISAREHSGKQYPYSVHFGAAGYEDYTTHKDRARQQRYIARHRARENWSRAGMFTAGFWSRWILWNKPNFRDSIRDTKQRFGFAKIETCRRRS